MHDKYAIDFDSTTFGVISRGCLSQIFKVVETIQIPNIFHFQSRLFTNIRILV